VVVALLLFLDGPTMAVAPSGTAGGSSEERLIRQVRSFLKRVNKAPVKSIQVYYWCLKFDKIIMFFITFSVCISSTASEINVRFIPPSKVDVGRAQHIGGGSPHPLG
jgi:hypothetical protein